MTVSHRARRHRAQAGTTLVELLVSVMIIGLVLVFLVGAFSSGLLESSLTRRNTAAEATIRFELEAVAAAAFDTTPSPYSDCFAIDSVATHALVSYRGSCAAGSSLRADVTEGSSPLGPNVQMWTITVRTWPQQGTVGSPVSTYKVNR